MNVQRFCRIFFKRNENTLATRLRPQATIGLHKKPHRGDRTTVCNSLTLSVAACGACDWFGFARNTATTFDVFYWLQVTNFDVPLNSAPNGLDYIDILVL